MLISNYELVFELLKSCLYAIHHSTFFVEFGQESMTASPIVKYLVESGQKLMKRPYVAGSETALICVSHEDEDIADSLLRGMANRPLQMFHGQIWVSVEQL